MTQLVTLLLDSKLVSVLCHFGNFGCGDGGWTPVMKVDGNKVRHLCTFSLSLATRVEKKCVFNNQIQVCLCRWKFSIILACEYSRFSLLLVARDVSSGGTSALQRQKFHTNDVKLQNFLEEHNPSPPSLKCLRRSNFSSCAYMLSPWI